MVDGVKAMEAFRAFGGVWMASQHESVARAFAVAGMRSLGMNENDFRLRDKLIMAVAPILERDLDERQERETDAKEWAAEAAARG